MARFVILEHDHPVRHWDLLLERGDVLWAWRLDSPPVAGQSGRAERNSDHRPLYLDYAGPVSGNRGRVLRYDGGTFEWLGAIGEGVLRASLEGAKLRGVLELRPEEPPVWRVVFREG